MKKLLTIAAMGLGLVVVGMNTSANAADFVKAGYGYGGGYSGGYYNNGGWNGNHNGGWNHGGYNGGWNNGGWNHNHRTSPPIYRPAPRCGGYGYGGYGGGYGYPVYNNGVVISTPGFGLGYGW